MPTNLRTTGFELPVAERLQRRLRELSEDDPLVVACYHWIRENPDLDVTTLIEETKQSIGKEAAGRERKWKPEQMAERIRASLEYSLQSKLKFREVAQLLLWEREPEIGALLPYHPRPEPDYDYEEDDPDEETDTVREQVAEIVEKSNEE
jgi:hypothetical protein